MPDASTSTTCPVERPSETKTGIEFISPPSGPSCGNALSPFAPDVSIDHILQISGVTIRNNFEFCPVVTDRNKPEISARTLLALTPVLVPALRPVRIYKKLLIGHQRHGISQFAGNQRDGVGTRCSCQLIGYD